MVGPFVAHIVCGLFMVFIILKETDWTMEANRARELIGIREANENDTPGDMLGSKC